MKASVLREKSKVIIEHREKPVLNSGEVLIKVKAVGICGSDIHYYEYGHIGKRFVEYPFVQGHEGSGVIEQVGEGVTNLKEGDNVVIEPGIPCSDCEYCRTGSYHLCPNVKFLSTPPYDGVLAEYITHPANLTYKIPNNLPHDIATLVEPLSVGIHTAERTGITPHSNILITGMGPVGLTMVLVAKWYGVKNITVIDLEPFRLEVAKKIGATAILKTNISSENVVPSFDVAIDTTGNEKALSMAIHQLKRGGKLATIGFPSSDMTSLPLLRMLQNEIDLLTIYRYKNTFTKGIALLEEYQDLAKHLITNQFKMADISEAFDYTINNKNKNIKTIVFP